MRFISEDTNKGDVKDPLSLNLYTYCKGNPIRLVDVDGHSPRIVGPSLDMSFSEFMSSVISIIPVIGDAKDFHEALIGIDTITGEKISISGRFVTLACAAIPFVPGKTGRELIEVAGKAANKGFLTPKQMNQFKSLVLEGKDIEFATKGQALDFIKSKFGDFPEEVAFNRSAQGWHFDNGTVNGIENVDHINLYSKKQGFRVHITWRD